MTTTIIDEETTRAAADAAVLAQIQASGASVRGVYRITLNGTHGCHGYELSTNCWTKLGVIRAARMGHVYRIESEEIVAEFADGAIVADYCRNHRLDHAVSDT